MILTLLIIDQHHEQNNYAHHLFRRQLLFLLRQPAPAHPRAGWIRGAAEAMKPSPA